MAREFAQRFLRRYDDIRTRNARDDLVQETAYSAFRWAGSIRDPERLPAAVRTIARRMRCRMIEADLRRNAALRGFETAHASGPETLQVANRQVPVHWLLDRLQGALGQLAELDRLLLLGGLEGFCGKELAERYQCSAANVKVRQHRARQRIREAIEAAVRAADPSEFEFETPRMEDG